MLAERINEWSEQLVQQGLQQGERQIIIRQARLRFGENDAATLAALLDIIDDTEQLAVISEWLVQMDDGQDFLKRIRTLIESR
jgi:hypothetical protein